MIDSLRLLSDSAAIEEGRTIIEPAPTGSPGISKYTAVHVKIDGKWLMASVHDEWIESPSTYKNLSDLEWLIGSWEAEEQVRKMNPFVAGSLTRVLCNAIIPLRWPMARRRRVCS